MDLGREEVIAADGILKIAQAIKTSRAGKLEIVTKELYSKGGKKDGVVARILRESMASHASRRRRWRTSVRSLDREIAAPALLQLDMMMASRHL